MDWQGDEGKETRNPEYQHLSSLVASLSIRSDWMHVTASRSLGASSDAFTASAFRGTTFVACQLPFVAEVSRTSPIKRAVRSRSAPESSSPHIRSPSSVQTVRPLLVKLSSKTNEGKRNSRQPGPRPTRAHALSVILLVRQRPLVE